VRIKLPLRRHGINTIFVDDRDPFATGFQVSLEEVRSKSAAPGRVLRGCPLSKVRRTCGDNPGMSPFDPRAPFSTDPCVFERSAKAPDDHLKAAESA